MPCDMCGKEQTAAIVMIEGARMTVCEGCASHGTLVRNIAPAPTAKPKKSTGSAGAARPAFGPGSIGRVEERTELIEQVHPHLPRILREHREKAKMTQEQFAAKLGVKLSTYHHYETGSAIPDIATARKIEHALHTPLVVHMKIASSQANAAPTNARSLELGDFMKKKR